MTRRAKIVTAVLVVIALIVLAVLFFWLNGLKKPAPVTNVPVNAGKPQATLPGGIVTAPDVNQPAENVNATAPAKSDSAPALKRLASSFAERYGSFSSLGNYDNQADLEVLMTKAFASKTEASVAAQRAKPSTGPFYGVTTRSISVTVQTLDESGGIAVLIVKTQRSETAGNATQPTVKYQDIRVGMLKEDGAWKVNSAAWQ
ncbi:MAG: hypothetical protein RLZZ324_659 [Candidatus Parcubacteria bacterium]|jgi:hypothetical protein